MIDKVAHVWNELDYFEKTLTIIGIPIAIAFGMLWLIACILVWPCIFVYRLIDDTPSDNDEC